MKTDALVERLSSGKTVRIDKKGLLKSIFYLFFHFHKPPVIFVDHRLVCQGRIPGEDEVKAWLT